MAHQAMRNVEPFLDSTLLLDTPEALRARATEKGYLFFRSLLDSESVLDLRRQILEVCQQHGWLAEDMSLMDGVSKEGCLFIESASPEWRNFYTDVQRLRAFNALALHPAIITMLQKLFDEEVLPHARNICRVIFPNAVAHTTPPHQDNLYIGGTDETWTAWIPAGDCPASLGSLAVAPGSHTLGKLDTVKATGAGGNAVVLDEETLWACGDFACGDVLICHSLTAHQGQDNESEDRLRISLDYRYQPQSHPVRDDSLEPHMHFTDWTDIYSGWAADDPLKYYWQEWDLQVNARQQ